MGKRTGCRGAQVLSRVVRKGFDEKVTLEQT